MSGLPARPGTFLLLPAVSLGGAAAAAALVLAEEPLGAGLALSLAGAALAVASVRARRAPRLLLLVSVAERLLDAAVLGAIAWVALPGRIGLAAAAGSALGTGYLAAYLPMRASAVGFRVGDSLLWRAARPQIIALGLVAGPVEVALWAVTAASAYVLAGQVVQLGRQREAR